MHIETALPISTASCISDRTDLFPRHMGPHVLPNSPFFSKLIRHARRGRTALKDLTLGVTKTYGDILRDALLLRAKIRHDLPAEVSQNLDNGKEVFIGVLALGGYEFTVAVLAVLALNAAVVPMCKCFAHTNWNSGFV
jgi:malonyl-CoA/methylmalonyl-CoA synthetase